MIKWLVIALAVYVLYRLFANDILRKNKKDAKDEKKDLEKKIAAGEMVKDPICGAYVSVDEGITVKDGAKTYHFCSYDCRDAFIKRITEGREESEAGKEEK